MAMKRTPGAAGGSAQYRLYDRFLESVTPGTLTWIGVRPAHRAAMCALEETTAIAGLGLEGDHRCEKSPGSGRQVTVISEEFMAEIARCLGRDAIDPAWLRRNLVVKGLNLNALRHHQFTIGEALFEAGALCHPCSRMEQALGRGGVAAMLGYGGLCCKIIHSGRLRVGDAVELVLPQRPLF